MQSLRLDGIGGQHLWGFLTALGSLSLLDEHARAEALAVPMLAFEEDGAAVMHSPLARGELPAAMLTRLRQIQRYLEQDLAAIRKPGDFHRENYADVARASHPAGLDILAGLACVIGDEPYESTLCAANGAGHQSLVQSMRDVLSLVEEEHLWRALFGQWLSDYRVPDDERRRLGLGSRKPTLRLDPADERLYALRLANPTTADDYCTELGAQALAVPAFALLPVVPRARPTTAITVSSMRRRQRVTFSWPLWSVPATRATVRALLWAGIGRPQILRARGVFAAFSADRVSGAKGKLWFAPSQGVW